MPTKPAPTRKRLIQQILAALEGPTPRDEVEKRILQQWPSSSKNPRQSVRDALRWDHLGRDYVLLDAETILPVRLALQGVRIRIRLERGEVQQGVLVVYPAFEYFLSRKPEEASFVDTRDQPLPTRVVQSTQEVEDLFGGRQKAQLAAFDLAEWFRTQRVRANDDVLVTVLDWETARFRLEHEPAQQRREDRIAQQNRALADDTLYRHVLNIQHFTGGHLNYGRTADELRSVDQITAWDVYDFITDWLPRKSWVDSERRIKSYLASIKKYVQFMAEHGYMAADVAARFASCAP